MDNPLLKKSKGMIKKIDTTGVTVPQYPGWHPLHIAAFEGDVAEVKKLINNGAYITAVDVYGRTPLHYARIRKHGKKNDVIAELLMQNGADDYSPCDVKGRSPHDLYIEYNEGAIMYL